MTSSGTEIVTSYGFMRLAWRLTHGLGFYGLLFTGRQSEQSQIHQAIVQEVQGYLQHVDVELALGVVDSSEEGGHWGPLLLVLLDLSLSDSEESGHVIGDIFTLD